MGRVYVGSVKEITWRDFIRIMLMVVILSTFHEHTSNQDFECFSRNGRGTYKIPRLNIPTNPTFLLHGNCNVKICGTGSAMTMKSVATFSAPALTYTVFLSPQMPLIVVSQL